MNYCLLVALLAQRPLSATIADRKIFLFFIFFEFFFSISKGCNIRLQPRAMTVVVVAATAAVIHKNKTKVSTHFSLDTKVNERSLASKQPHPFSFPDTGLKGTSRLYAHSIVIIEARGKKCTRNAPLSCSRNLQYFSGVVGRHQIKRFLLVGLGNSSATKSFSFVPDVFFQYLPVL